MDARERQAQSNLPVKVRLENQTIPEPNTGCLLWTGLVDKDGYGKICIRRKHIRAHRAAYELAFGSIPPGRIIQHRCDTPACCNPDHLELGTWLSNMRDKVSKGRFRNQHMGKAFCKHGHEFTRENTRIYDGKRTCYQCLVTKRGYKLNRERVGGRLTHCKLGHEFTPENTHYYACKPKTRYCIKCIKLRNEVRRNLTASNRQLPAR